MQIADENILTTDEKEVLSQLNSVYDNDHLLWQVTKGALPSRVYFIRLQPTIFDIIVNLYLQSVGCKSHHFDSIHDAIQQLQLTVANQEHQENPDNSQLMVIEFDENSLRQFKEEKHFSALQLQNIKNCYNSLGIICGILSFYCDKVDVGMISSGVYVSCKESKIELTVAQLISLLYFEMQLHDHGLKINFIQEWTDNNEVTLHIEFVSMFNESFSSFMVNKFEKYSKKKIESEITRVITVAKENNKSLINLNKPLIYIPLLPLSHLDKVIPLKNKEEALGCQAESTHGSDFEKHIKRLEKHFNELTNDLFPQAQWIKISKGDDKYVFVLKNLNMDQMLFIQDFYKPWIFVKIVQTETRAYLQFENLEGLSPDHDAWDYIFVHGKLSLRFLAEYQNFYVIFQRFFSQIPHDDVMIQYSILNNNPTIRFIGDDMRVNIIMLYMTSCQPDSGNEETKLANFIFNLSTKTLKITEHLLSDDSAEKLAVFVKAFLLFANVFVQCKYDVKASFHAKEVEYQYAFTNRKSYDRAKDFFAYLNQRYQQLCFTIIKANKNSGTFTVSVSVNDKVSNNPRTLFEVEEMHKLANDNEIILKIIALEVQAGKSINTLKKYLGKALINFIKTNNIKLATTFFEFGEWGLQEKLPELWGKTPLEYAKECNADDIYAYLHKKISEDTGRKIAAPIANFDGNPGNVSHGLKDSIGQIAVDQNLPYAIHEDNDKKLDNAVAGQLNTQIVEKNNLRTNSEIASLKFIRYFCLSAKIPSSWQLLTTDSGQCVQLQHKAEMSIGLIYDYFFETGLQCCWQESVLSVNLNELNRWHEDVFSEHRGGVKAIEASIKLLINRIEVLEALLSIVRPIIGISDWQATTKGWECSFREPNKTENLDYYLAKRTNTLILLDWVRFHCGLAENPFTLLEQSDCAKLHLSYASLKLSQWLLLIDRNNVSHFGRSLLKNGRLAAAIIQSLQTPLINSKFIDYLLEQDHQKQQQIKAQQSAPVAVASQPKSAVVKKDKTKEDGNTSKKSKNKPKNIPHSKSAKAVSQPSSTKTNTKKDRRPHLAPQDSRHWQPVETIPTEPHTRLKVSADKGIDLSLFAPTKTMQTVAVTSKSRDKQQALPQAVTLAETEILAHLDNWVAQMNQVVASYLEYCQQQNLTPQSQLTPSQLGEIQDYVVAWQEIHAQVASILSILPEDHSAKRYLFNQHLYSGMRIYEKQKHCYFPPVSVPNIGLKWPNLPAQRCLMPVDAICDALTLIAQSQHPSEKSMQSAAAIIQEWSTYLGAEFANYNIARITEHMNLSTFAQWIQTMLKQYNLQIHKLLAKPDQLVRNLAIQFYVVRIGELTGHIPKFARTQYLSFCRAFRNKVVHSYNKNQSVFEFNQPILDLQMLQAEVPRNDSPRFFAHKAQLSITSLYINQSYRYQSEEICLLTTLRLVKIIDKLSQPVPLLVCNPIELAVNTNLATVLKDQIYQLNNSVEFRQDAMGMLFIPTECQGMKSALALKFIRDFQDPQNPFQLKEICYANVRGFNAIVQDCMQTIATNWPISKPLLKMLETMHIYPEQESSSTVLQVELMVQLAERRLYADHLLATASMTRLSMPNQKATTSTASVKQIDTILLQLRGEHIELAWQQGHHEFYFRQQLIKPAYVVPEVAPAAHLSTIPSEAIKLSNNTHW